MMTAGTQLLDPQKVLGQVEIREGMQVSDFGCGALGHFVLPAARLVGAAGKVFAVDIQKSVLQALAGHLKLQNIQNVELVWGDIERLRGTQIADDSLDVVLLVNNLFLARDRSMLGREALRVLKVGGKLVVVDWQPAAAPFGPPPGQRVSREQARLAMQSAGARKVSEFEAGPYHYGLVFEKP